MTLGQEFEGYAACVRRGADDIESATGALRELNLGATAVGIGRPYGYGAVLGGQAGVEFVLSCLLAEADLTMALNGYATVGDLTREVLVRC